MEPTLCNSSFFVSFIFVGALCLHHDVLHKLALSGGLPNYQRDLSFLCNKEAGGDLPTVRVCTVSRHPLCA